MTKNADCFDRDDPDIYGGPVPAFFHAAGNSIFATPHLRIPNQIKFLSPDVGNIFFEISREIFTDFRPREKNADWRPTVESCPLRRRIRESARFSPNAPARRRRKFLFS